MKGITVHQPYAQLIAWGAKAYETRGWSTNYRGWIAIHAGKSPEVMLNVAEELEAYKDTKAEPGDFTLHFLSVIHRRPSIDMQAFTLNDLPRGAIVAVARLTDCIKGEQLLPTLSAQEQAFGFFSSPDEQRYGWRFEDVCCFPEPIAFKGQQGLFTVPENVVQQMRLQWVAAKKGA